MNSYTLLEETRPGRPPVKPLYSLDRFTSVPDSRTHREGIFSISVDDGHPSDLRLAELLKKNSLQGTFFVPIHNREGRNVMSRREIIGLAKDFEIGSHTNDHCYLKSLTLNEARQQISAGKNELEDMLGKRVAGFCYPGGKFGPQHVEMLREQGFEYARTCVNMSFDPGSDPYAMPTTMQFFPHDKFTYLRNFTRGGHWQSRRSGLAVALSEKDWLKRLYAMFDWSQARGMYFHLWTHSWEVDELGAWLDLEQFLTHVAANTALQNRLSLGDVAQRCFVSS